MVLQISKIQVIKQQSSYNYNCSCIGITLRQWAILISLLFFILTALVTTFTALGTIHTKQLLEMLERDIELERERQIEEHEPASSISTNEALLHESQEIVTMSKNILSMYMWIAWLNLVLTALLIYGVCTKTSTYILPWLTTSITTYLLIIISILMVYFDVLNEYYFNYSLVLVVSIGCFPVFLIMWLVIFVYQVHLNLQTCLESSDYHDQPPTVIKSNSGFTHTLSLSPNSDNVQLV